MKKIPYKIIVLFIFIIILGLYFFYKKINIPTEYIDISKFNINTSNSTNVTEDLENAMNYAVKNNKILVISKGIYNVNNLQLPSNLYLKCSSKAIFKLVDNAGKYQRCFTIINAKNVNIYGEINIDGNESNQSYKNEHMHGLFIYNSRNIYIESINSYNAVGDNVSISGGSDRFKDYSKNIKIDYIKAEKAGRKNLVLEHVTKLRIKTAFLDNTKGGTDGNGSNSLDVEPFDYHGYISMTNTIDYLNTVGCGNDFSAGTNWISNRYCINIGTFIVKLKDLPSNLEKSAIFSYGIKLNINKMYVTLADSITSNVIDACYKSTININSLQVNGGIKKQPLFIANGTDRDYPKIKVNQLAVDGKKSSLEEFME